MYKVHLNRASWLIVGTLFLVSVSAVGQKTAPKPKTMPKPVILAVLDNGKRVEPIAAIDAGKLVEPGAAETQSKAFANAYYKPGASYSLVFGGTADGKLSIVKSNIGTECGGTSADSVAKPVKAKLAGFVMALATTAKNAANSPAYRRRPTIEERGEIEKLVRAEFTKQGVSAGALKNLRYHNLTALDVDGDDVPEFVGSYWVAPTADERRLLFFIAEQDTAGKVAFSVSDYSAVKPDDVMSGEVKDLDTGIGHELLLDLLDVDGDGIKEIFTIGQAFEGNNYYVYKRAGGEWTKVYETYNYRCAY